MKVATMICIGLVLLLEGVQAQLDARCGQVMLDFQACATKAFQDYERAIAAGDDGREAWTARKFCTYITQFVDVCGTQLIGECNIEEQVIETKDRQLDIIVWMVNSTETWESDKCPPVKAYLDRKRAREEANVIAQQQTPSPEQQAEQQAERELKVRCNKLKLDYQACTYKAHQDYAGAMEAGDDGREAWFARKACKFITECDVCANILIGECNTEEKVLEMRDEQIENFERKLSKFDKSWESEKCPAVKAYLDRKRAMEGGDDVINQEWNLITEPENTPFCELILMMDFLLIIFI